MTRPQLIAAIDAAPELFPAVFGGPAPRAAEAALRRLDLLLRGLASAVLVAIAGAPGTRAQAAETDDGEAQAELAFALPLYVDGRYLGDVSAQQTGQGDISLALGPLRDVISGVANASVLNRLERLRLEGGPVTTERLRAEGFEVRYDTSDVTLRLILAPDQRRLQELSLSARFERGDGAQIQPARSAGGVAVAAQQSWAEDGAADGFAADIDGFVTLGDTVSLIFQGGYDESRQAPWRRGEIALVHDDIQRALRWTAGEFQPRTDGFQAAPGLVGVGLARAYSEIQPSRNIRPASRSTIVLERNSDVQVVINGLPADQLRLSPGLYDLRDLPFTDGLSDVRLIVDDGLGRREIKLFNGFLGPELIDRGVVDFAVSAGALRDPGETMEARGFGLTGFVRSGVTQSVTLGANVQIAEHAAALGASMAAATPIGVASVETALSRDQDGALHPAAGINLRAVRDRNGVRDGLSMRAELVDSDFRTLDPLARSPSTARVLARAFRSWPGGLSADAGASYERARFGAETWRASAGVSRTYDRFAGSLRAEWVDGPTGGSEARISAALAIRLGERQIARAGYDGPTRDVTADWERMERTGVGDWSARVRARGRGAAQAISGQAAYLGNRFRAAVAHDVNRTSPRIGPLEYDGARVRHVTRASAGTAVGWAGGRIAFGRDLGQGFLVLTPDNSLKGRSVPVKDGSRVVARLDGAPVLAPLSSPHRRMQLTLDAGDLPDGYDLGDPKLQVSPGLRSGFAYHVGSPSITVQAKLRDQNGLPLGVTLGFLLPAGDEGGEPIAFFTNKTGRLIAERVKPGRYLVHVQPATEPVGELVAPATADGFADLGDIYVRAAAEALP